MEGTGRSPEGPLRPGHRLRLSRPPGLRRAPPGLYRRRERGSARHRGPLA